MVECYLLFFEPRVWANALPAALLDLSLYRLSRRISEAILATRLLVSFLFAGIISPPYFCIFVLSSVSSDGFGDGSGRGSIVGSCSDLVGVPSDFAYWRIDPDVYCLLHNCCPPFLLRIRHWWAAIATHSKSEWTYRAVYTTSPIIREVLAWIKGSFTRASYPTP